MAQRCRCDGCHGAAADAGHFTALAHVPLYGTKRRADPRICSCYQMPGSCSDRMVISSTWPCNCCKTTLTCKNHHEARVLLAKPPNPQRPQLTDSKQGTSKLNLFGEVSGGISDFLFFLVGFRCRELQELGVAGTWCLGSEVKD